jgi:hypothetical protein
MADALITKIKSLITLLESFNVPVYRQGSMEQEATYPDTFITWWNNNTPDHAHYDNAEYGSDLDFNVYVFSNDPEKTYSLLSEICTELMKNGWIPTSHGFDAASDEPTHTGRGIEAFYLLVPTASEPEPEPQPDPYPDEDDQIIGG